jgi:hypothetical protein
VEAPADSRGREAISASRPPARSARGRQARRRWQLSRPEVDSVSAEIAARVRSNGGDAVRDRARCRPFPLGLDAATDRELVDRGALVDFEAHDVIATCSQRAADRDRVDLSAGLDGEGDRLELHLDTLDQAEPLAARGLDIVVHDQRPERL